VNDVIMRAMAPDVTSRYQRAGELLSDVLAARQVPVRRRAHAGAGANAASQEPSDALQRIRSRDTPAPRFCWHCSKPLHARTDRCPFCGERQ
jgi:hypothetical protein